MSWGRNLYSPYGLQQQPYPMYPAQMQTPANGLMFIDDIKELDTLQMAPGSFCMRWPMRFPYRMGFCRSSG